MAPSFKETNFENKKERMKFYATRLEYTKRELEGDALFYHLVSSLTSLKTEGKIHQTLLDASAAINLYFDNAVEKEDVLGLAVGDAEFISLKPVQKKMGGDLIMGNYKEVVTTFLDISSVKSGQSLLDYDAPKNITFRLEKEDIGLLTHFSPIIGVDNSIMEALKEKVQSLMEEKAETFSIYRGLDDKLEVFLHSPISYTAHQNREIIPGVDKILEASISGVAFLCNASNDCHSVHAIDACVKNHDRSFYCPIHTNLIIKQLVGSDIRYKFPKGLTMDWRKKQLCLIVALNIDYKTNNLYCNFFDPNDLEPVSFGDFLLYHYSNKKDTIDYTFISEIITILSNNSKNWRTPTLEEETSIQEKNEFFSIYLEKAIPILRPKKGQSVEICVSMQLNPTSSKSLLYHGTSYFSCESILKYGIDLDLCTSGHIGSGFYTTDSVEYAKQRPKNLRKKFGPSTPLVVMVFETSVDYPKEEPFSVLNLVEQFRTLELHEYSCHEGENTIQEYRKARIVHAKLINCRDSPRHLECNENNNKQRTYRFPEPADLLLSRLIAIVPVG
eukprot:NODE_236_length_13376_cov_0.329367.p1 type:complete len:557 gc:universal NODE_236_length_13376_cov_0.329367:5734-4064(-)